jgi:hypothetical protein
MAITQHFDLNMIPDSEPVIVHVNQYDTGTGRLIAHLYDGDVAYTPTGTAAIQGTKPDGRGFMYSATLDGNTVTADLKDQMSVVAGHVRCQIVVSETSGITGTFCFDLEVQESALPDDAEVSESDYPIIEELIHEAQEAATTAATAEVNAEASAEDSEAWAVGTRGGEPVSPSDPTYHNNSKYWAEHGGGGEGGHVIMDEDGNDMPARNTLQFKGMAVEDDAVHGITVVTGSRGVLPYLYIDSEAGSTVTVVAPDSSVITPTAAGSGHWECEVPGYGVYVIHSVLDSEDATVSVTIDSVKEYHITDSHYEYTINITAQVGATVRVACGTEIYTGTGTGSPVAFVVHQASATYTLTATLDGATDTQTVTSASTTGQSTSVTLHIFTATLHISTTSQELAGATITITKGGSTVGTTAFPASGTLEVNYTVHETGSYTASVTYSGDTYSDTQPVSSETTVNFEIITTKTITVTMYSATEDTVTFTDQSGVKTEVFATGQSSKSVDITIPTSGMSITFTSSVAKDPSNLSNDYSKSVTVTDSTSEIYVMPDSVYVAYWYGYIGSDVEEVSKANGYRWSGSSYPNSVAPTYDSQSIQIKGTTNTFTGISARKTASSLNAILQGVTDVISTYGEIGIYSSKTLGDGTNRSNITDTVLKKATLSAEGGQGTYYFTAACCNARNLRLYALWLE